MVTNEEFMEARRKLLESMERQARENGLEVITKTIPFTNNDVPEFLERLREFEAMSKKAKFRVRYQTPQLAY